MAGVAGRALSGSPVRTLLAGAIDYAGLFPPAALSMDEAVRNYAAYQESGDAWALGRFVVPIARLGEFRDAAASLMAARPGGPWRVSLLAGARGTAEWADAARADLGPATVEAIELRAHTVDDVAKSATPLPAGIDVFFEIPVDSEPHALLRAIRRVGGKAKVRTGGVTRDAFPSAGDLARFIVACADAAVPFKATAGLHHPLRATYRLTYEPDSPTGEMFGFLNVLLAAAFARAALPEDAVTELLDERDPQAIRFDIAGVTWRGRRVGTDVLEQTRRSLAVSVGSCSFREPIEELEALGLL